MSVTDRLAALSAEIGEAQTDLRIIEEQLAFQADVADDARIRAVVSETPIADRDSRIAQGDLARLEHSREDVLRRLSELHTEQDRLLERLLDEPGD